MFAAEEVPPIAEEYYGGRLVAKAAEFARAVRNVYSKMQQEEPSAERLVAAATGEAKRLGVTIERFAELGSLRAVSPAACRAIMVCTDGRQRRGSCSEETARTPRRVDD